MQLVWFRDDDLRLVDNPALNQAIKIATAQEQGVIALYIHTPQQWVQHDLAPLKQQFLLARVDELGRQLAQRGIELLRRESQLFGDIPRLLTLFCQQQNIRAIHASHATELNELRRDRAVANALPLPCHWYHSSTILPPGSVLTGKGEPFKVFTPFRRAWLQTLLTHEIAPLPSPAPFAKAIPWSGQFNSSDPHLAAWPVDEGVAEMRLQHFIARGLTDYAQERDYPAIEGTSKLSPYLAAGILSPRQCLAALMQEEGGLPQEPQSRGFSWLNELIWREFYRHLLILVPRLSMNQPFKMEMQRLYWPNDPRLFAAWCHGETGYPIIDAAMRCLNQTGWMHNRLRMIVASFLTKDLQIDWRWGERYFMQHLIDGDLAANNGGWQWAAGTGADAAPYFRIFNPTTQGERFDAEGAFIRRWVPELADVPSAKIHAPHTWLAQQGLSDYPQPIVDHAQARQETLTRFKALKESAWLNK